MINTSAKNFNIKKYNNENMIDHFNDKHNSSITNSNSAIFLQDTNTNDKKISHTSSISNHYHKLQSPSKFKTYLKQQLKHANKLVYDYATKLNSSIQMLCNQLPHLNIIDINQFKSQITIEDTCPATLIDFPIKELTSFNLHPYQLIKDWIFLIYYSNNKYYISPYTVEGFIILQNSTKQLDFKLQLPMAQSKIINFIDLQMLETHFHQFSYIISLKESIEVLADEKKKLLDTIDNLKQQLKNYYTFEQKILPLAKTYFLYSKLIDHAFTFYFDH